MPTVVFVNEHWVVEAEAGRSVRDVAREAGVAIDAVCWVEEGAPGAAGPRSWGERLRGLRGWRRLARQARVLGDLKVYSVPAGANRVGQARSVAPAPSPVRDPSAPRKRDDAASTAAHIHGHPSAVGRGVVASGRVGTVPEPPPSHSNAARPLPTVPPPQDEDEGLL